MCWDCRCFQQERCVTIYLLWQRQRRQVLCCDRVVPTTPGLSCCIADNGGSVRDPPVFTRRHPTRQNVNPASDVDGTTNRSAWCTRTFNLTLRKQTQHSQNMLLVIIAVSSVSTKCPHGASLLWGSRNSFVPQPSTRHCFYILGNYLFLVQLVARPWCGWKMNYACKTKHLVFNP